MRYNIRRKRGMLQMSQYYEPEFKKKIVRLHLVPDDDSVRLLSHELEDLDYSLLYQA